MRKNIHLFLFICISAYLLISSFAFAQQSKIYSLLSLLKKDKEDTSKVIHLNKLSNKLRMTGSYDSSILYCNNAIQLAQHLNFNKGIANAYTNIGIVYDEQGNYPKAIDFYFKALKIEEVLGNKIRIANNMGNIGVVYQEQGDAPK